MFSMFTFKNLTKHIFLHIFVDTVPLVTTKGLLQCGFRVQPIETETNLSVGTAIVLHDAILTEDTFVRDNFLRISLTTTPCTCWC